MSDKTVLERLQVKNGRRLAVLDAPEEIDSSIGGANLRVEVKDADVVLVFAPNRVEFDAQIRSLSTQLQSESDPLGRLSEADFQACGRPEQGCHSRGGPELWLGYR